jgi:glycosyltransferase involved in cell wall biosynthesis
MSQLQRQVGASGLQRSVHFIPQQGRVSMADLYSLADAVISVAKSDGFPQTIYEAWASGRFMILSDLPQYREELSNGTTARLVDVSDTQALVDSMKWISQHPEARHAARNVGPILARTFADKNVETEKMNKIYSELLSK